MKDNTSVKINYQLELEKIIKEIEKNGDTPSLLLHSCCGPCSSYVLEYLSQYFLITIFYYNPNIYPSEEYWYRVDEQQKIIDITKAKNPIKMVTGAYDVERFYEMARGMEDMREGGQRCHKCYEMRLKEAAIFAKKEGYDYFTTTLSISPHKNSQVLNHIAKDLSDRIGVKNLPSDFKKKGGYKRSCEITREYGFYRQDYCGCVFSKREMEERNLSKEKRLLREKMKELGDSLDRNYMDQADDRIIEKILVSKEYQDSNMIFTYLGVGNEINTSKLIKKILDDKKRVCLPYCVDDSQMLAYEIESLDDLTKNNYGIPEPDPNMYKLVEKSDIDYVLVPCCTVDMDGNRLGFGRGYYDRYLKDYKGYKALAIRKKQIADKVPVGHRDIKIENIISE